MFHICFYLRLDIVYVYVMPRPPSIETIPGAPLDQANTLHTLPVGGKPRQRCERFEKNNVVFAIAKLLTHSPK